jgi:nucleotide-binding universal stress UspA family protein
MYQNIVVAIDDSEQADRSVTAAGELAKLSGGSVTILHVREHQDVIGKGGGSFDNEDKAAGEALVAKATATLKGLGVTSSSKLLHMPLGHLGEVIVQEAKDLNADTIVVGSHGRTGVAAAFLGSTAYKVVHLADRPVLIVR